MIHLHSHKNNPAKPKSINYPSERRAFTILEFSDAVRLSRATLYNMINAGTLKTVKIGARRLVPASEADRLLGAGGEA